ncbi:MAG: AAA family ATPase [Spirochaetaceae bacterium]|nr:AAA family ATPase [Spirochaetaceae bacterium]
MAGLLSFGPEGIDLPLQPLNVLIGPNGSGKSNLLEVLALLRASPINLPAPETSPAGQRRKDPAGRRRSPTSAPPVPACPPRRRPPIKAIGGVDEWLWKAPTVAGLTKTVNAATIDAVVQSPPQGPLPLRHVLEITRHGDRFEVADERIENEHPQAGHTDTYFFYRYQHGEPFINDPEARGLRRESVKPEMSILSQVKDPERYPVLGWLQDQYEQIRLYRDWTFGPSTSLRRMQSSHGRNDILDDGADNLILVLSSILPRVEDRFVDALRQLYEGVDGIYATVRDGNLLLSLKESGGRLITMARLSDGTLRYMTLLCILLHPDPPPLVAIEEPELGLHPDLIPEIAELLVEASRRMQLVVTTHSRMLVDALTAHPSSVVVCTKEDGASHFERLDEGHLKQWLENYSASATLGDLWSSGDIGGNRW